MFLNRGRTLRCLALVALGWGFAGCGGEDSAKSITTVKLAGPASLTGANLAICATIINGAKAGMQWLNEQGGFAIGKGIGKIELVYEDDASVADNVTAITTAYVEDPTVNFIMSPYSSGLTLAAAGITDPAGKLLLISGGASNSIYSAGSAYLVASIGLGGEYHKGILDAVKKANGTLSGLTIGFLYEDESFSQSVQKAAVEYATQQPGLTKVYENKYPKSAKEDNATLLTRAAELAAVNPDIILGGGHAGDGRALTKLLHANGARPKALSLLVAPGESDFYDLVKACPAPCDYASHPAEGVSGPSHWEVGVKFDKAAAKEAGLEWYGPSQEEFLTIYQAVAGGDQVPSYHSANGATLILSLALAMQKAGSVETEAVRTAFHLLNYMSFWGVWGIDETGANSGHKMVEAQWQQGEKQIVWPDEGKTAGLVYPIH